MSVAAGLRKTGFPLLRSWAGTERVNTMQFLFESGFLAVSYVFLPTITASDLPSILCRKSLSSFEDQSLICPGWRAILPSMVETAIRAKLGRSIGYVDGENDKIPTPRWAGANQHF